jgi:hypothetical protein
MKPASTSEPFLSHQRVSTPNTFLFYRRGLLAKIFCSRRLEFAVQIPGQTRELWTTNSICLPHSRSVYDTLVISSHSALLSQGDPPHPTTTLDPSIIT